MITHMILINSEIFFLIEFCIKFLSFQQNKYITIKTAILYKIVS